MEVFKQLTFDRKARGTGARLLKKIASDGDNLFLSFSRDTDSTRDATKPLTASGKSRKPRLFGRSFITRSR